MFRFPFLFVLWLDGQVKQNIQIHSFEFLSHGLIIPLSICRRRRAFSQLFWCGLYLLRLMAVPENNDPRKAQRYQGIFMVCGLFIIAVARAAPIFTSSFFMIFSPLSNRPQQPKHKGQYQSAGQDFNQGAHRIFPAHDQVINESME